MIEDEKGLAGMVKEFLSGESFEVELAYDGEEGFNKAKAFLPDVIIMDVNLPKINGFELCEDLRDLPEIKKIPIIMLTARISHAEEQVGFASGADLYMTKPYDLQELLQNIKNLIGQAAVAN